MLHQNVELLSGNSALVRYVAPEDELPEEFRSFITGQSRIGLDIESGGLDPLAVMSRDWHCRLVGFGGKSSAWVLDGRRWEDIRWALDTGNRAGTAWVAHNAPFDALGCKRAYGVSPANVIDTLALALLIYPPDSAYALDDEHADEVPLDDRHQLKPLSILTGSRALIDAEADLHAVFAEMLGPCPPGSDQAAGVKRWIGQGFTEVPADRPEYWIYNGLDAMFGLRVLNFLVTQWGGAKSDILRLLAAESRLGQMLAGPTWRGLRIDRDAMRVIYHAARAARNEMQPAFLALSSTLSDEQGVCEELNPGSPKQVSELLSGLGVVKPVMSDAGLISTDKKFGLPRLLEADQPEPVRELAGLLKTWRGHTALAQKVREIDRLLPRSGDGRVHPRINPLQAKTGRMSIAEPALQNLPKKDTRIRSLFLADPGYVLVGADFAQIEYRVAAALSRDQHMINVIKSGIDLHTSTAGSIFGDAFLAEEIESPKWNELRGYAKNCGFLTLYGGGPGNLVATSGGAISQSRAEQILAKFHATYPDLKKWSNRINRYTELVSLSGRRTAVDPSRTYANTNYSVQGPARDLFADALLNLRAAGWGDYLWLVIHDEILLMVPAELADEACKALEAAMNTTFLGVPILAEAEIRGERWMPLEVAA